MSPNWVSRIDFRKYPFVTHASPWSVEDYNSACFIVRDANGQQLAYVYYEDEPGRQAAGQAADEG
jgi:hypothetical protein